MNDKNPTAEELKSCPFCGGEAEYLSRLRKFDCPDCDMEEWFYVECHSCQVRTTERTELKDSLAAWNTRALTQSPPAQEVAEDEPTREMLLAGFDALDCTFAEFEDRLKNIGNIYKAMIEADDRAASKPAGQTTEEGGIE